MDSGFKMVIHSIVITAILYVLMVYVLKQSIPVAKDRSILIGAIILIYMTLYGHTFPPRLSNINPNFLNR